MLRVGKKRSKKKKSAEKQLDPGASDPAGKSNFADTEGGGRAAGIGGGGGGDDDECPPGGRYWWAGVTPCKDVKKKSGHPRESQQGLFLEGVSRDISDLFLPHQSRFQFGISCL